MTTTITPSSLAPSLETAWQDVDSSFERFCLTARIGAIEQMLCEDAQRSNSPARRIIVAEAASATAGAGPRERSVSMVARLLCIARGCAVTTAMKLRCRPGERHRRKTGLAAGP